MHRKIAAAGRSRAALAAGTTVAALVATALTAVPATAAPSTSAALASFDGTFSGSGSTTGAAQFRYDAGAAVTLADLGPRQSVTLTTTITADAGATAAFADLWGVGFLSVVEGETPSRSVAISSDHHGDPIVWAQDNSGAGIGLCANDQFYVAPENTFAFGDGPGYRCGLPNDSADQSSTAEGSTLRFVVAVRADGTWSSSLTPLDADGDPVASYSSSTPTFAWSGSLPPGTAAVTPFIRTGLGTLDETRPDWSYGISGTSLSVRGDDITPTSAVLDPAGYDDGWISAGHLADSGWFYGNASIDVGRVGDAVRMSNATTSGVMTQLVTPVLERAAGEPSTGAAYDEFHASFTVGSATGGYQDGLLVQVSPDNGQAARSGGVVTLWHHDGQLQVGGIFSQPTVDEDDPQWWFNRTFAKVSADEPHTVGLTQRYVEGKPDTLVVTVDGEQVGEVGTWEAYHDQFGGGKQVSKALLFRSASSVPDADGRDWGAQPAVPANLGNGFLFSDIAYSVGEGDAIVEPADTTVHTDSATLSDWEFTDRSLGHHALLDEGMRIWTDATPAVPSGSPEQHKSAGYLPVDWSLAQVAAAPAPSMDVDLVSGTYEPGLQLSVDLNGDDVWDGFLVKESYRDYWWLSEASSSFTGDPRSAGMDKGPDAGQTHVVHRGSLLEWASQFPQAHVDRIGYSFGSGAVGDMVLTSMTYNRTTFDFAATPLAVCTETSAAGPVVTATNLQGWAFGESRSKGHNDFVDGGLHVWTESNDSLSKAAGYRPLTTPLPLSEVGSYELRLADGWTGVAPSLQLGVDQDGDGDWDGYLVNEPSYYPADHWWTSKTVFGLPSGMGYASYGTLAEYAANNPAAKVISIGYSLGSGVKGDAVIESITVGCRSTAFSAAVEPVVYPSTGAELSTNLDPNGWTEGSTDGSTAYGQWVDGGYTFGVPGGGDWPSAWIEREYTGDLASLGSVDFEASRVQYFGIHVHTSRGWISYEKEPSYAGRWWSESDLGVGGGMGYASFASLADYVTNNPGLAVDKVRVLYTAGDARKTTLASVTFGGVRYAFDHVAPHVPTQSYLDADDVATFAGKATTLPVKVFPFTTTGTVVVKDGETVVGSAEVVLGVAQVALAGLAVGTHELVVSLDGGADYVADEVTVDAVVAKNESRVTVAWPVRLTRGLVSDVAVTVSAVESGVAAPTGTVELVEVGGATPVATATLGAGGVAHLQVPGGLSIGYHRFVVRYLGDAATEPVATGATRIKVVKAVTTISVQSEPMVYGTAGRLVVTLSADGEATPGKVRLRGVGEDLQRVRSTRPDGTVVFPMAAGMKAGKHTVELVYGGTDTVRSVTTTYTFTIAKARTTTTAVLTSSSVSTAKQGVLLVRVSATGTTPKGKVRVAVTPVAGGPTVTRWADLRNGWVKVPLGTLPAGEYRVRGSYQGGVNWTASAAATTTLAVG